MGQRSQMYVIAKREGRYYLTANYYQWNYAERMVSRARGTLEQIIDEYFKYDWYLTDNTTKLRRIMDVNWDMHDIVLSSDIVKEFTDDYEQYWKTEGNTYAEDFFGYCFAGQDNNDGQMYMYIDLDVPEEKREVWLCFTRHTFDGSCPVYTAADYINQYLKEYGEDCVDADAMVYTKDNIEYIKANSKMLSRAELNETLTAVSKQYEADYHKGGT